MTYLISHATCLNNTCGRSYELSRNELQQPGYKPVFSQTLFFNLRAPLLYISLNFEVLLQANLLFCHYHVGICTVGG